MVRQISFFAGYLFSEVDKIFHLLRVDELTDITNKLDCNCFFNELLSEARQLISLLNQSVELVHQFT